MSCQDAEFTHQTLANPFDRWVRAIVDALLPPLRGRAPRLDVEALPDHLKRDLGFLDGRMPPCERDF